MTFATVALIGGGVSLLGGLIASNSAKKAANTQAGATRDATAAQQQAQRESIDFQREQAGIARADQQPWRDAGQSALTQLTQRTGAGGDLMHPSRAFSTPFNFQADPGYAFRQSEGAKGVERSAAARGGLLSGATLKAMSRYGQDSASAEYSKAFDRYQVEQGGQFSRDQTTQTNQFNRLASVAGVGQTAANNTSSAAQTLGQSVGSTISAGGNALASKIMGAGNARASGYVGQANALTGAIGQGANFYQGQQYMKMLNQRQPQSYGDIVSAGYGNGFGDAFTNMTDPAYG